VICKFCGSPMMDISTDEGEEHWCQKCKASYGIVIRGEWQSRMTWKEGNQISAHADRIEGWDGI
jgi:hypothetical protein